jgi:hypothetical protein
MVPSTVAGSRNAHAMCSRIRTGHDNPISSGDAPAHAFSHKIARHAAAPANSIAAMRPGRFLAESAIRPPR